MLWVLIRIASPVRHSSQPMLWVLIRIVSQAEAILMSTHNIGFYEEAILMSTHNIGFYEDLTKIIFQLSSNIIKYTPYLFFWTALLESE